MHLLRRDLAAAWRGLARAPGLAAVVVVTLALGLGVTAAVAALLEAVLFTSSPYARPHALFLAGSTHRDAGTVAAWPTSYADFADWRRGAAASCDLAAFSSPRSFNYQGDAESIHLSGEMVSENYFRVLGIAPYRGRTFTAEESRVPAPARVVLISHRLWSGRFGADPALVGRDLRLNGDAYRVVGILPPGFLGLTDEADVWMHLGQAGALLGPQYLEMRKFRWLQLVGRPAPGLSRRRAATALATVAAALAREYPDSNQDVGARTLALDDALLGDLQPTLYALLGGALLVLLIACNNVANLLLARAGERRRELAVRAALGARRAALLRSQLAESALLGLLGGLFGVLLAWWTTPALVAASGIDLPTWVRVGVTPAGAALILVLAVLAGVAFGLPPAVAATSAPLVEVLRQQSRGNTGRGANRLEGALAVAQIALAVTLLIGAGLLLRAFTGLLATDLGFRAGGLATLRVDLSGRRYAADSSIRALALELRDRLAAIPGVRAAAVAGPGIPSDVSPSSFFTVDGSRDAAAGGTALLHIHSVGPGYFAVLGVPLLAGREIGDSDTAGAPPVAVVSRSLAQRFWPGETAIGRRLKVGERGSAEPWMTVVGLAGDLRHQGLADAAQPAPDVYVSLLQNPPRLPPRLGVLVRAARSGDGAAAALLPQMRRTVAAAAPDLPPYDEQTMEQRLTAQVARQRFLIQMAAFFALLAAAFAALGIYGVVAHAVARRTREIGTRVALGASRADVLRLVVGWGLLLAAAGTAAGILGALSLARLLASLVYGTAAFDLPAFTLVPLALFAVAVAACSIPARRALRIEPLHAMRME